MTQHITPEHNTTLKEQCNAANVTIIKMIKEHRYHSARKEIDRINTIINGDDTEQVARELLTSIEVYNKARRELDRINTIIKEAR